MPCATLESMAQGNNNYYNVLEIDPSASQEEIYDAYKKAKATFSLDSPDLYKIFTYQEAMDWIDLIEEAYAIIGHPNTRRVYDREKEYQKKPTPKNQAQTDIAPEIPDGYHTTPLSQYKMDVKMEEFIQNQEIYDGLLLKKVREYKKIDLDSFSKYTCIAIRHLYAIENNNFSVLPAPVFVRGYIIQYCRVLGLDQEKVVSSFMTLLVHE